MPKLVTESNSVAGAKRLLKVFAPTFLENWPAELCRLSFAHTDLPLSSEEHIDLLAALTGVAEANQFGAATPDHDFQVLRARLTPLEKRLAEALSAYPHGGYVRLGSRGPKDSPLGAREGFRVTAASHGLELILGSTERIRFDLSVAYLARYSPHLFVRAWQNIPPWREFRCFMVERQLAGISQYDYVSLKRHPEIIANANEIAAAIAGFFQTFRDTCHLDDVVFDVIFREPSVRPDLLEINPPASSGLSDLCLFGRGDLNGTFRYIGDGHDYSWVKKMREQSYED